METVALCPVCGHANPPERSRCSNCMGRLTGGVSVTREEADERDRTRDALVKRRRRVRMRLLALALLGIVGWITYSTIGVRLLESTNLPVSTIGAAPVPGDWPMFQRDPSHSAFASDPDVVPTGSLKWRFETEEPIFSSPAVVGGRVYLTTGDRRIVALDGDSGDLIWEHKTGGPVHSSPAVAGDFVFAGLIDGTVLALNKDSGEVRWEFDTESGVFSSPAAYQGALYVSGAEGNIFALDAMTGEELWSFSTDGTVVASPAVNQEVVAVNSRDEWLYIINRETGSHRLSHYVSFYARSSAFKSLASGSPVLKDDLLYVVDGYGNLIAVDWHNRALPFERLGRSIMYYLSLSGILDRFPNQKGFVWGFRDPGGSSFIGAPAVAGDRLYISSTSGTLFALDRSTGEPAWTFNTKAFVNVSPTVVGQTVFLGDIDGRLYAVDALTGELRWQLKVDGPISSPPVVANGTLFASTSNGTLYAIR